MTMFDPPAKVPGRLIQFWWDEDTESWGIVVDGTGIASVDLDDHDPARGVFVRPTNPDLIARYLTGLAEVEAAEVALLASAGLEHLNGYMTEACATFNGPDSRDFCGTCGRPVEDHAEVVA